MPKLNTYTSQFQGLPISGGRRADAQDFGGDAAAATGELARTTQKVGDALISHQEETEQRRALVGSTEIRAKYARELDQAAQTGADTAAIKEKMEADLAKIGEGFQTTKGQASLDMHAANTSLMFDEQANRIEVQRAAATARMEGQKYMQSSSAILQSNPLYLPAAEQGVDDLMATFKRISPQQKAEMAQDLKQNLNMTAAIATARIDPEGTKKKLEAGEWTLSAEQRNTAINRADAEISSRRVEENYRREAYERELTERDNVALDKHMIAIFEGRGSMRAVLDDSDLKARTREHILRFMEVRAKELNSADKKSDQATLRSLWTGVHVADDDSRKIINADKIVAAVGAGKLNTSDANMLMAAVKNQKDENNRSIGTTLYAMSASFQRALESGPEKYRKRLGQVPEIVNEYTSMAQERIGAARAANDVKALRDLTDPTSKSYIGSKEFMQEAITRVEAREQDAIRAKMPHPTTQEEYDALPVGTIYIAPDGQQKTKQPKPPAGRTSEGRIR